MIQNTKKHDMNTEPDIDEIAVYIQKARDAQQKIAGYSQEQVDELVTAVCWAIVRQDRAEQLARLAVDEGGFGNYHDKVSKIRNRCMGTLRDMQDVNVRVRTHH